MTHFVFNFLLKLSLELLLPALVEWISHFILNKFIYRETFMLKDSLQGFRESSKVHKDFSIEKRESC